MNSVFTEGMVIDSKSKEWNGTSVFEVVEEVNQDGQLEEVECNPRDKRLSEVTDTDDIFPNSIIIVREQELDRICKKIQSILSGHRFPTRGSLIILNESDNFSLVKQIKRDLGFNPDTVSNQTELRTAIKSHLNDMDPRAEEGVINIIEFEEEVQDITNNSYELVPEKYRDDEYDN